MTDNTEKEHLGNLPNSHSEISPDVIIPADDKLNINQNYESENTEVHHHAHDTLMPHHKKNWKSKFWEFLILFLVFCGILSKNTFAL